MIRDFQKEKIYIFFIFKVLTGFMCLYKNTICGSVSINLNQLN